MQGDLDSCRAFIYDAHNVLITNAPREVVGVMWKMDVTEGKKYLNQRGYIATWMTLQILRASEISDDHEFRNHILPQKSSYTFGRKGSSYNRST